MREGSTGPVSRQEHENRGGAEPEALWEEGRIESSAEYRGIKQTTLQMDARRWGTGREALWDEGRTKSGTEYQEIGQEALGGDDTNPNARCRGVGRVVLREDEYEESEDGQKNVGPDAPWENKRAELEAKYEGRKQDTMGSL